MSIRINYLNENNKGCYGYLNVEEVIQDKLNIENSGIKKSKEEEIKYYEIVWKVLTTYLLQNNMIQ